VEVHAERREMATERTMKLRRPRRWGADGGVVPHGTKGMYDQSERIRTRTARALVAARRTTTVKCAVAGCERVFPSRLVNGEPERKACGRAHRLKLWRAEMREKGYVQRTVDGVTGWMDPDGRFYPHPGRTRRERRVSPGERTEDAVEASGSG
jgi:hypothetical protein